MILKGDSSLLAMHLGWFAFYHFHVNLLENEDTGRKWLE
jgi:hypothetical protein